MKNIWTVARREIRSYFDHPTAYILVIAFLALGLFLAFRTIYAQRIATLRPLFDLLPWLFAVFVPAIAMRSLAEERRGKTLEWMMAQPLNETELIVGKFLGNWLFVLIALAATLPTAIGILLASEADPGIVIAQYVGGALLAAEMVAIGIWASSVTRNQITAFILGAAVSFTLLLIGLPVVGVGLPPLISGAFARLSVMSHFENVARGVIDLRDVIYFASVSALFLTLAGAAVSRERLSRSRGAWRRLRLGTVAVAAVVLVTNLLGGNIRGRLDLTQGGLYTLSDGSRQIMDGLEDIVTLKLFVSRELPPEVQLTSRDVRDLIADLRRASNGNLRVEGIDPDDDPEAASEAESLGIRPIEFNVLRDDEFQVRRGWFGIALTYADKNDVMPLIDRTDDLEYRLVSSIATMTADRKPAIGFATGFGARSPYEFQTFQQVVSERYDVKTIALEDSATTLSPDSLDLIVIAAPQQAVSPEALQKLQAFTDAGGSALVLIETAMINPQYPVAMGVQSGLEPFLEQHGVRLEQGMLFDMQSHANVSVGRSGIFNLVRGYPLWPIVLRASEHAVTRNLENLSLGWAGALEIVDTANVIPLFQTTEQAGVRPADMPIDPGSFAPFTPADSMGKKTVAVAFTPAPDSAAASPENNGHRGRLVIVADANFLEDQFVGSNPQNLIFTANAIDWLAQDEALINIRSKHRAPPPLTFASDFGSNFLKWGNLVGVPALLALFGLFRISGRRRRAMRWWGENTSPATPGPSA
jgi:ABC-2 type transport system permease protein